MLSLWTGLSTLRGSGSWCRSLGGEAWVDGGYGVGDDIVGFDPWCWKEI